MDKAQLLVRVHMKAIPLISSIIVIFGIQVKSVDYYKSKLTGFVWNVAAPPLSDSNDCVHLIIIASADYHKRNMLHTSQSTSFALSDKCYDIFTSRFSTGFTCCSCKLFLLSQVSLFPAVYILYTLTTVVCPYCLNVHLVTKYNNY